jgi:hypothetical protein
LVVLGPLVVPKNTAPHILVIDDDLHGRDLVVEYPGKNGMRVCALRGAPR